MRVFFSGDVYIPHPIHKIELSESLKSELEKSDYSFCCMEAPYVPDSEVLPYEKIGCVLKQGDGVGDMLKYFSHVTLANNHIYDYGIDGLKDTLDFLKKNNIIGVGAGLNYADAYKPIVLRNDDVSVGILCAGEAQYGCIQYPFDNKGGYAWILNPFVQTQIAEFKKQVDFVACFAHAGLEDCILPLPEWRACYRSLVDAGADIVIASHPHVVQGKEIYNGKYIYYSLGNFCFCQLEGGNDEQCKGLSLSVDFDKRRGLIVDELFSSFRFDMNVCEVAEEKNYEDYLFSSNLLKEVNADRYFNEINKHVCNCWDEYYKTYYSFIIKRPIQKSIINRVINKILKQFVKDYYYPSKGEEMLYHNIMIDTHRFAVMRAIESRTINHSNNKFK